MKEKSLLKNALWNFLYTGMNVLFPVITSPYVSRVLGADNVGKVEFAKSFSTWYILFAAFGITLYGVREIAIVREEKNKLSKVFTELFIINSLFSVISVIVYLVTVFSGVIGTEDRLLFLIMTISIVLNSFNIDWFYQGIEVYNYITIRNAVVKIISLILIFVFVNNRADYNVYALIAVVGTGLSGIWNVFYSRKFVKISFKNIEIIKHLHPLAIFFLTIIVTNLYTNADATLLGFMSNNESVAFMQRAKSIKGIATTISLSIISVLMPRASFYLSNNFKKYKELLINVPRILMFFSVPISIALAVLSEEALFIIGGVEFLPATNLMRLISLTIPLSSFSTFLQQQVLIPSGRERIGLFASIISGLISVVLNLLLIPKIGFIGSGVALFFAEVCAVSIRYKLSRNNEYKFLRLIDKHTMKYVISSIVMVMPIFFIKFYFNSFLFTVLGAILIFPIIYILILYILKDEIILKLLLQTKTRLNS